MYIFSSGYKVWHDGHCSEGDLNSWLGGYRHDQNSFLIKIKSSNDQN
jgi:hypothetical protein